MGEKEEHFRYKCVPPASMPTNPNPKAFYTCTCPDWTRKQSMLINSEYSSELVSRDWSDSDAGVKGDNKWCKHIYAVLLARGELSRYGGVPSDIPLERTEQDQDYAEPKERYQGGYGGHDFTGNWGIRQARGIKT